jgi:hypothetical protein
MAERCDMPRIAWCPSHGSQGRGYASARPGSMDPRSRKGQFQILPPALLSRRSHKASMPPESPFVVKIERDTERQGRFRWRVFQDGIMRDASVYSFATKRQAQVDGDKFVQKLNNTWRIVK